MRSVFLVAKDVRVAKAQFDIVEVHGRVPLSSLSPKLGRVDKRVSHSAIGVIQTGICDGDRLGTRPDVGLGVGVFLSGSSCLSAPRMGASRRTTGLFLMVFSGLLGLEHHGGTCPKSSENGQVPIGSSGAGRSPVSGNRSWRR